MSEKEQLPEFTAEQLAYLGFESADAAKKYVSETRAREAEQVESEFSSVSSGLNESQLDVIKGLFGDSKADVVRGIKMLRESGLIAEQKKSATAPKVKAPASPASDQSGVDYAAEYQRLKAVNEIAARNFFVTHRNKILSKKVG